MTQDRYNATYSDGRFGPENRRKGELLATFTLGHHARFLPPAAMRRHRRPSSENSTSEALRGLFFVMEMRMTHPAGSTGSPATALPALIVLGLDDGGKAHASWFGEAEVGMAEKAAGMMGMAALPVADTSDLKGLANKLPQGRVFESGRAFVPFVKRTLYDAIATHLPPGYQFPVRAPDDRPPAKPTKKASAADAPESGPKRPEPHRPTDWEKIEVGSLVLATEGPTEGWFEARVTKVSPEGLLTLRWRDWLEIPAFTRKNTQLALLHPDHRD